MLLALALLAPSGRSSCCTRAGTPQPVGAYL